MIVYDTNNLPFSFAGIPACVLKGLRSRYGMHPHLGHYKLVLKIVIDF